MIRFCIILSIIFTLVVGCKSNKSCPAYSTSLSEKQIKKRKKKAGKSYGLFSDKVNKSSGYKNRKATKKEKDPARRPD